MGCKACKGRVAPSGIDYSNDGTAIELRATTWTHVGGDGYTHDLGRPEDAGTFCSWACLANYARSRAPVPAPAKPKRISCVIIAAFDEVGMMTHEEKIVRPEGEIAYDYREIENGVQVTVRFDGNTPSHPETPLEESLRVLRIKSFLEKLSNWRPPGLFGEIEDQVAGIRSEAIELLDKTRKSGA